VFLHGFHDFVLRCLEARLWQSGIVLGITIARRDLVAHTLLCVPFGTFHRLI